MTDASLERKVYNLSRIPSHHGLLEIKTSDLECMDKVAYLKKQPDHSLALDRYSQVLIELASYRCSEITFPPIWRRQILHAKARCFIFVGVNQIMIA